MSSFRILYTSAQVRQELKRLFSTSDGRRVAISAFVGYGAQAYLPRPQGIELLCWPKPGSTNPNAIAELKELGIDISFADSLHMKVYWTEDKGAIIASANLSTEALGASGQKEIGVYLPSGAVDIDKIIASVNARPYSAFELGQLNQGHKEYVKRNPIKHKTLQSRSFKEWFGVQKEFRWKLGWWWSQSIRLAPKSQQLLKQEYGSTRHRELMTTPEGYYSDRDWLLCFNVDTSSARWFSWMFVDHVVKVRRSDDGPCQMIQVWPLKAYDQPPFKIDKQFTQAFRKATREIGGMDTIMDMPVKPPARLLNAIYAHLE